MKNIYHNLLFYKFALYGFLKNQKYFEPFIIIFLKTYNISFTQIGILYAIKEITTNFLEIPSGIFADAFGRKKAMLISFSSYIISFIIFYSFHDFYFFSIAMLFFGFGEAFRSGTHKAMIYSYLKYNNLSQYKVEFYGHTRASSQIGSAISVLISAYIIIISHNIAKIFFFSIIPYIIAFILILSYPNYLDYEIKNKNKRLTTTFKDIKKNLKIWYNIKILLNISLYSAYFKAIKDYIQAIIKQFSPFIIALPFIKKEHKTTIVIAFVYFVFYILSSFASANSKKALDKIKSKSTLLNISLIFAIVSALLIALFYKFKFLSIIIIIYLFIFLIENIRKPIAIAYINEKINTDIFASILSLQNNLRTILTALISIIFGFLIDTLSIYWAFFIIGILFILIYPLISIKEKNSGTGNRTPA